MENSDHIVVDATGHVAGKLAGKIAKLLLNGVKVSVVCAENALLMRTMEMAKADFKEYLNKRCIVNPRRGPFHYREPKMHLAKIIRRMISYKKWRGKTALTRLSVHEGIPAEFENCKRHKFAKSMYYYNSKPHKNVSLGDLLSEFGWKHGEQVKKLTERVRERESLEVLRKEETEKRCKEIKETKDFSEELKRRMAMFA
ncbi:ribosomal protein L13a [Ordospora colligata]|uniref:Ribosomal protein L13a n=1 Tax=Ordospora colligata OC4 TaxID=1354746 RepID=A0A0B2ULQ3_9MICR|nr:ribosomal protein L13a [Ordospora colligata OC4]KHN69987.1 ribosomal protein L13a [Ordospora colligata OC4]TBU16157.1 ribosomal protein L13a [Ordospora colligata]TBU16370.1 ribosomal protein L13a [Ordospora colligata]TBU19074.1 ribosomal protein L13a [Ordospora colligata]